MYENSSDINLREDPCHEFSTASHSTVIFATVNPRDVAWNDLQYQAFYA